MASMRDRSRVDERNGTQQWLLNKSVTLTNVGQMPT